MSISTRSMEVQKSAKCDLRGYFNQLFFSCRAGNIYTALLHVVFILRNKTYFCAAHPKRGFVLFSMLFLPWLPKTHRDRQKKFRKSLQISEMVYSLQTRTTTLYLCKEKLTKDMPPVWVVAGSVADPDPGSGIWCFLTMGSGIGFFQSLELGWIPNLDPGS